MPVGNSHPTTHPNKNWADSETMDEEVVAQQDQEANPPSCIYSEETRQIASKYMRDCKGHTRLSNKQKLEAVWKDFNANGLIDLAYEYNERNKPTYHEVDSESAASGSQPLYRENPLKQSSEGNENIWAYNDNGSFVTTNSGDSESTMSPDSKRSQL